MMPTKSVILLVVILSIFQPTTSVDISGSLHHNKIEILKYFRTLLPHVQQSVKAAIGIIYGEVLHLYDDMIHLLYITNTDRVNGSLSDLTKEFKILVTVAINKEIHNVCVEEAKYHFVKLMDKTLNQTVCPLNPFNFVRHVRKTILDIKAENEKGKQLGEKLLECANNDYECVHDIANSIGEYGRWRRWLVLSSLAARDYGKRFRDTLPFCTPRTQLDDFDIIVRQAEEIVRLFKQCLK